MLGNPLVPPILDSIKRFARGRITMHLQIVLCPGINDGAVLDRTLADLAAYHPYAASVALIPVGLTRHRSGRYPLQPVDSAMARSVIAQGTVWQHIFKKKLGTRFVFLADEFYLKAGQVLPGHGHYEHFAQVENGVGMGRQLLDSLRRGEKQAARRRPAGTLAIVTGLSAYPLVRQGLRPYRAFLKYKVYPVRNDFLGAGVTVAGLLAGRDIVRQLAGKNLGDRVVLPPNCLNDDGLFIDDMTVAEVAQKLRVPVVQLHGNSIG
jgi:putative radical SAM enzyme (TIGR03279 family)